MVTDAWAVEGPLRVIEKTETSLYPLINVWLLLSISAAVVILLVILFRNTAERVGVRWGLFLTALRAAAAAFVILLILNPTLIHQTVLRIIPTLAVMVDRSGSMMLSDSEGGVSRMERLQGIISGDDGPSLAGLSDNYDVRLYLFDEQVSQASLKELREAEPVGRETRIVGSLAQVLEENRGRELAGIILFTDGRETVNGEKERFLPEIGHPLAVVGLGDTEAYRDIRIAELKAPDLAFVGKEVTIEARVESVGYPEITVPIVLKRDGYVVATNSIGIDRPSYQERVSFRIPVDRIGSYTFSLEIPEQAGEAIYENNRARFKLSVVRDKIRVLMISGVPSWNYRFFRRALKTDPSIDLLSFVILRSPTDVVNVPQYDLSLIPFPMNELFSEELDSFDLLIFDNFQFTRTFPERHLDRIRSFVKKGGAFALFGGEYALLDVGFTNSAISDILPFSFSNGTGQYINQPVKVTLTEEGRSHPITRLTLGEEENEKLWGTLPRLHGYNRVADVKEDAVVLGRYNTAGPEDDLPFLAAYKYGKGRSLAILTDDLWRWNFEMVGMKKGNTPYLNFVKQIVRWLVKDPRFSQVRLTTERPDAAPGEEVVLEYQVLKDDYSPAADAALEVWVVDPSGDRRSVAALPSGAPGEFRISFMAEKEGFYRVQAKAALEGRSLGENELILEARAPGSELEDGSPDHAFLRRLASASRGGRFLAAGEFEREILKDPELLFPAEVRERVIEEKRVKLMERFSAFLILAGLLSTEWFLRRRRGLV